MSNHQSVILSIDQGTTSSRTMVFKADGEVLYSSQREFPQIYPADGWVEHDPDDIWKTTLTTLREAYAHAKQNNFKIAGIGITNQRETTIVWDRRTGTPIYNAIVWQDRRTADKCVELKNAYSEEVLNSKTGLLLDPYFSATKAAWILDHVESARSDALSGHMAFGTVDSFLISKLTGGASHFTDATNASRTNLFNIHTNEWDDELLELFDVPASILPTVLDSSDDFGVTKKDILGESIPIFGVAGDQQAAAIGQCCFEIGSTKSTYGTGCFVLMNTGEKCVTSQNRLLSTIAYRLNGKTTYAIEGSIFVAGAAVQWLRDNMKLIKNAADTEGLARSLSDNSGLFLVPAFTGLGAPHWNPNARGAIFGITRATGQAEIVRAALESVCYQTADLLKAMEDDGIKPQVLKVDGGMVQNDWMVQFLSNILSLPIDRPKVMETTALGVAYLAGLKAGLYANLEDVKNNWRLQMKFKPNMQNETREGLLASWGEAVELVLQRKL